MNKIFLTASWNNLIMANYAIDPAVLQPYLPAHTLLDTFNDQCYVSLVGFMFENVKIKGIAIPFHTHFPEVNLRFYVKHTAPDGSVQRGVVFISEIVPKRAIAWVANHIYKEKYTATAMKHVHTVNGQQRTLEYGWRWKGTDQLIAATVSNRFLPIEAGSAEEFIFEHYAGFAKAGEQVTNQYTVEHPVWRVYPVQSYHINCNFEAVYGKAFAVLDHAAPSSVFVAEGSAVLIREKTVLRKMSDI